jgi:hypothetical protein
MNAAASTYAALFQAVSSSGIVKTADINWKKTLGWGLGVPAAAAGAYGLYRMTHPSGAGTLGAAAEPGTEMDYPEEYADPYADSYADPYADGYTSTDPYYGMQGGWYA